MGSIVFTALMIGIIAIPIIISYKNYKESSYYKSTNIPFFSMKKFSGARGEYYTYDYLKSFESVGAKFLFNAYIPYGNGKTSEIDLIMIYHSGIFVIESKNYGGWIFGNETKEHWYQTLPAGRGQSQKKRVF